MPREHDGGGATRHGRGRAAPLRLVMSTPLHAALGLFGGRSLALCSRLLPRASIREGQVAARFAPCGPPGMESDNERRQHNPARACCNAAAECPQESARTSAQRSPSQASSATLAARFARSQSDYLSVRNGRSAGLPALVSPTDHACRQEEDSHYGKDRDVYLRRSAQVAADDMGNDVTCRPHPDSDERHR